MAFGPHGDDILYSLETIGSTGRYEVTGFAWAGMRPGAPTKEVHYFCRSNHPELTNVQSSSIWTADSRMDWAGWDTRRHAEAAAGNFMYIRGVYGPNHPAIPQSADTIASITRNVAPPYTPALRTLAPRKPPVQIMAPAPQIFQGYVRVRSSNLDIGTVIVLFGQDKTHSVEIWTTGNDRDKSAANPLGFPRDVGASMYLSYLLGYPVGPSFTRSVAQSAWENTWTNIRAGVSPQRHMILLERVKDQFIG